jgi:amino acid transporter
MTSGWAPPTTSGAPVAIDRSLGHGRLRTIDCVAQSLAVGPIFSAAVFGAVLFALSGGVGPFVMVLTTIGVLGLGVVISELAKRVSGTGTVYEYVAHTLGRRSAIFAAGAYHLAAIALFTGIPIVGGILLKAFCAEHFGFDPPWWVAALVVLAFTIGVNLVGVQMSVRTQLAIVVASLVPFLILAVAVILDGGATGNTADVFNPSTVAASGATFDGLLFAILMFVGFELAAALGEEAAEPARSIPTALIAAILICGLFYVLTQYVGAIGSGGPNDLAFDFAVLADHYVGSWLGTLVELAVLLDIVAVGIGFAVGTSRGLFTLARDGLLPSRLAALNRRGVPATSTLVVGALALTVVGVGLIVYGTAAPADASGVIIGPPDALAAFTVTSTTGAFVICVVYVLLAVGGIAYFAFRERVPGAVIAGFVGLATAGAGVAAQFADPTAPVGDARWGRHLGLVILGVVAIWLIGNMLGNRGRVRAAGARARRREP